MNKILSDHSPKAMREFAYTMAGAFIVIFCLLLPWLFTQPIPRWPLFVAAIFLAQAWLYPPSLIPVYRTWMKLGAILGWINTRIILGVLFFLLITPTGFVQRKRRKLHYKTGFDSTAASYKIYRHQRLTAKNMDTPF